MFLFRIFCTFLLGAFSCNARLQEEHDHVRDTLRGLEIVKNVSNPRRRLQAYTFGRLLDKITQLKCDDQPSPSPTMSSIPSNAPSPAQVWIQIADEIIGKQDDEAIGSSVSFSSDGLLVVVGGYQTARVYKQSTDSGSQLIWEETADLSVHITGEYVSVAISPNGEHIVIGDPDSPGNGKILLFQPNARPDGWSLVKEYSGEENGDRFGYAVDIADEGRVAAGAPFGNYAKYFPFFTTSIDIAFRFDGVNNFGTSVSMKADGGNLLVGAFGGAAYLYSLNDASILEQAVWQSFVGVSGGGFSFGQQLSLSEQADVLAIGTKEGDYVDVYRLSIEDLEYQHVGDRISGDSNTNFGVSVSLSGDGSILAVGASKDSSNGSLSGAVYLYRINDGGCSEIATIKGDAAGDQSGSSVSLSGDGTRVAIGSVYNDDGGSDAGSTRVFQSFIF